MHLILFDIDGTILKFKDRLSVKIFSKLMEDLFAIKINPEKMPDFAGNTDLAIMKEIARNYEIDWNFLEKNMNSIWKKIELAFSKYCTKDYIDLLPGINELLLELDSDSKFQLCLLTGNFKANAYQKLKTYNLDGFFPFGAFGDDNENRNLLPDIAIERAYDFKNFNSIEKSKSLVIGDSFRDIECAKTNGIPVLAVGTGYVSKEELLKSQPDFALDDFSDVENTLSVIKRILGVQ